ncbi:MAG: hypothetical protein AAGJ94_13995 [Pseudomonadota bacterium]
MKFILRASEGQGEIEISQRDNRTQISISVTTTFSDTSLSVTNILTDCLYDVFLEFERFLKEMIEFLIYDGDEPGEVAFGISSDPDPDVPMGTVNYHGDTPRPQATHSGASVRFRHTCPALIMPRNKAFIEILNVREPYISTSCLFLLDVTVIDDFIEQVERSSLRAS